MLSRTARLITMFLTLVLTVSCSSSLVHNGRPEEILNKAMGEGAAQSGKVATLPGADWSDLPYVPIITPPDIARIWIYDHVTPSDDLVIGHWIFVKIQTEKWYIEEQWGETAASKEALKRMPSPPKESAEKKLQAGAAPESQQSARKSQSSMIAPAQVAR